MKQWLFMKDRFVLADENNAGDPLEAAVKFIKGYCNKHVSCDHGCVFKIEHSELNRTCMLYDFPPVSWEYPMNEEATDEEEV